MVHVMSALLRDTPKRGGGGGGGGRGENSHKKRRGVFVVPFRGKNRGFVSPWMLNLKR